MQEPLNIDARRLRAALILKGETISSWAKSRGVSEAWIRQCLTGKRKGPSANRILMDLQEVVEESVQYGA